MIRLPLATCGLAREFEIAVCDVKAPPCWGSFCRAHGLCEPGHRLPDATSHKTYAMEATLPTSCLRVNRRLSRTDGGGRNSLPTYFNAGASVAFGQPGAREGDA